MKVFAFRHCFYKFATLKFFIQAGVAQLVEHNLAKVRVASSSLVSRSKSRSSIRSGFFFTPFCPGGGIGRHAGLKILWSVMAVRVQVPPGVQANRAVSIAKAIRQLCFFYHYHTVK